MQNLQWNEGAPDKLEPGMLVQEESGFCGLIGHSLTEGDPSMVEEWFELEVKRWAWVIKPHELEWSADMAGKHAKGRPEQ